MVYLEACLNFYFLNVEVMHIYIKGYPTDSFSKGSYIAIQIKYQYFKLLKENPGWVYT